MPSAIRCIVRCAGSGLTDTEARTHSEPHYSANNNKKAPGSGVARLCLDLSLYFGGTNKSARYVFTFVWQIIRTQRSCYVISRRTKTLQSDSIHARYDAFPRTQIENEILRIGYVGTPLGSRLNRKLRSTEGGTSYFRPERNFWNDFVNRTQCSEFFFFLLFCFAWLSGHCNQKMLYWSTRTW